MSATQKSWRGLGSEAMACHETNARRAARRRKQEEEAIFVLTRGFLLFLLMFLLKVLVFSLGDALAMEVMDVLI